MNTATAKIFNNFSPDNEVFTWNYDGKPWSFEPNVPIMLEATLAEHFAKHLIDRELTKRGISIGNQILRDKMYALCVKNTVIEETDPEKLKTKILNAGIDSKKQLEEKYAEMPGISEKELQQAAKVESREEKRLREHGEDEQKSVDVNKMDFSKILRMSTNKTSDDEPDEPDEADVEPSQELPKDDNSTKPYELMADDLSF